MDPTLNHLKNVAYRLPRASGDGPMPAIDGQVVYKAAPRERGWTLDLDVPEVN